MAGDAVLSLDSGVHELLGGLLELLLSGLRVGVGRPCSLVLNLDVYRLAVWTNLLLLLLTIRGLVCSIHSIIHHTSVKRIIALLLLISSLHDRPSDYPKSTAVLRLALLLELRSSLDRASHLLISGHVTGGVLLHLGIVLRHVCVL